MADRRRPVRWTDEARSALDEAISYIVQDSPQGARTVLDQALEAAAGLATLFERGRVVPEIDHPSIREVFVGRYRLMYQVRASEVVILTFLHGARDFAKWRKEN